MKISQLKVVFPFSIPLKFLGQKSLDLLPCMEKLERNQDLFYSVYIPGPRSIPQFWNTTSVLTLPVNENFTIEGHVSIFYSFEVCRSKERRSSL